MNESKNQKNIYFIIGAIVIAGLLIAGALIYTKSSQSQSADKPDTFKTDQEEGGYGIELTVVEGDHIRGNPDAPVTIIEYSDFECPFCARFHPTLKQILNDYPNDVRWVYRHFPLDELHPIKARREAIASECINEIAGNEAFWQFTDRFFELTPSNNQTDIDTILPQIAQEIGVDQDQFQLCLESGRYDDHIQDNIDSAVATGGRGTPWSIIIAKNGQTFPVNGAQSYQLVKQLIDLALSEQ